MSKKPDVLVIVADCAGAEDVFQDAFETPTLPNLADLMGRGTVYDGALSPSNWTLPSHASMFTGRLPWEHGAVSASSRLADSIPTFAETAISEGYRTASFSGNPFISDRTGLTRGFEVAGWGGFGDCLYRGIPGVSRPRGRLTPRLEQRSHYTARQDKVPRALQILGTRLAKSLPEVPDLLARFLARILERGRSTGPRVSPWIEECLNQWLRDTRKEDPILVFVNLLDAHEPYLGLSRHASLELGLVPIWEAFRAGFRTPQRHFELPPQGVRRILRQLYRIAIRIVDERVGNILRSFEEKRNIDNTLIIATSDHGQAFGEGGIMYHGHGTEDVLFRVPLIVVHPGSQSRGEVVKNWTSTTELADVIRKAVSEPRGSDGDWKFSSEGSGPDKFVWALGSSSCLENDSILASSRREAVRRARLVGYRGDYKVVLDPANATYETFAVDSSYRTPLFSTQPETQSGILQSLRDCDSDGLARMVADDRFDEVLSRLASWGYT